MNENTSDTRPLGADPFQFDALVATVMGAVRATEQDRPRPFVRAWGARRVAVGLAATGLVLGGLYGLAASQSPGPGAAPHATFHEAGLAFDYPASWARTSSQGFSAIAGITDLFFIGSGAGTATCVPMSPPPDSGTGLECTSFEASLKPDTLVARIEIDQQGIDNRFPGVQHWDIAGGTRRIVIGGLPALTGPSIVSHLTLNADRVTTWVLSSLQDMNRHYQITVAMRGPDLAGLQAQVDALLASVMFDPPNH
jgi:hypothetical protein